MQMKGATAFKQAHFGLGSGAIHLDDTHCTGLETSLLSCPSNIPDNNDCCHVEDAGIACSGDAQLNCKHAKSTVLIIS